MKKLLIIKPSSLGDIIHGLVAAQSIREQMPGCSMSWVVEERFAPVVRGCPTVDQSIVFERYGGLRRFFRLIKTIRREQYDCVLDFQGLARSAIMALLARAHTRLGRTDAREGAGWAYQQKAPLPPGAAPAHAIEILLQFLPLLGLEAKPDSTIHLAGAPLSPPHDQLAGLRPIVLLPNSRVPKKEWEGFTELTRLILLRHPGLTVVWSSHQARPTPEDLAAQPRLRNLTGQTTLPQMIGIIQSARLAVANDSGPMHIAAAVGTPVVACFGPTAPERFGPYPLNRPTHRVVRAPNGDLARLEVATVYEAVRDLLSSLPATPRNDER